MVKLHAKACAFLDVDNKKRDWAAKNVRKKSVSVSKSIKYNKK